jgi:hypothetical protein
MLGRQLVLTLGYALGATVDEIGSDHVGNQKQAGDSGSPDNNVQHGVHRASPGHGAKGKSAGSDAPYWTPQMVNLR